MCVISLTTLSTIGTAVASSITSAASAVGSAVATGASAIGSGVVTGAGWVGSGLSTVGSSIASGVSSVGSSIASGASSVGSSIASGASSAWGGITSAAEFVSAPFTEAYAAGAAAAEEMGAGLTTEGALAGSTEAVALNPGAEASMLASMAKEGIPITEQTVANAAAGAEAARNGSMLAGIAGATSTLGGLGSVVKGGLSAGIAGAQVAGGIQEAKGYRDDSEINAAIQDNQAKNAEIQAQQQLDAAEVEAKDISRKQRLAIGKGRVVAAANGVMLEGRAESAPAMWEQDMQAEAAWDREKLFYNAELKADAFRRQANIYRLGAAATRSSGNLKSTTAIIRGLASGGVSLLGSPATTLFA